MRRDLGLGDLVGRMVSFVRAGYPPGAPESGYIPLLALLRRRLSDDEVVAVAAALSSSRRNRVDSVDVGVAITRVTDELPSRTDLRRVQRQLATADRGIDPNR